MYKPFLSIEQQMELAEKRGLIFDCPERDYEFLLRKNYYNSINIYGKFFILDPERDMYMSGTKMSEIIAIYYFDREVRTAIFKKLMIIETNIKSTIANVFCSKHPDPSLLFNRNSFDGENSQKTNRMYLRVTNKLQKIIVSHYQTDPNKAPFNNSIDHYMRAYGEVPLWVLVNFMSFNDIANFYSIMHTAQRHSVAKSFRKAIMKSYDIKDNFSLEPHHFLPYTYALKDLRNTVAHDTTLASFSLRTSVPYHKFVYSEDIFRPKDPRQNFYSVFLLTKLFMSKNNFAKLNNTIRKRSIRLDKKLSTISTNDVLSHYGFPMNWHLRKPLPQL